MFAVGVVGLQSQHAAGCKRTGEGSWHQGVEVWKQDTGHQGKAEGAEDLGVVHTAGVGNCPEEDIQKRNHEESIEVLGSDQ